MGFSPARVDISIEGGKSGRLDLRFIDVVLANPEPEVPGRQFYGQGMIFQGHPRRPDFLAATVA